MRRNRRVNKDTAFCYSRSYHTTWEQNAMPTNHRFTQKFAESIVAVLGCHDRVIFKGYLPFGRDEHLNGWVDRCLRIRRKDFLGWVEQHSQTLVDHAKRQAEQAGAPYQHLQGFHRKEKLVQQILSERRCQGGLVAVLCVIETCRTVKLFHGQARPRLAFAPRPQRVLYYYFLDPHFGLMYVRLQTWFPFTIQVYVNGHEWLARQMLQRRLGFVQHDNAFTQLDHPVAAQRLADRFPKLPWVTILKRWARQVNPLLRQAWLAKADYYWVIDQAEYSTDVLFANRTQLAQLYPRLLEHALLHFSAQDILSFLGRRLHPRFDGEVLTDCKKDRLPGARIKHRVKNNWLKMYDKFGQVLRIETVINQPGEFKVRRCRLRQGRRRLLWCPMNKGVANFYQYHAVARAANHRYLDALAVVDLPCATGQQLERLCRPADFHQRRRRGLNLLHPLEQRLFRAVLRGDWHLNGLRNRDLAHELYGPAPLCPAERRRRTIKVCRYLQLLRAHGLLAKIPHSNRYRLTTTGQTLLCSAVYLRLHAFPKTLKAASSRTLQALRAAQQ